MPRTIDEGFRDFLKKLTPSSTESDGAKKHRGSIQACLSNSFRLNRFTRIGSFGNGTSISGYSDVDYLACLPNRVLTANSIIYDIDVKKVLKLLWDSELASMQDPMRILGYIPACSTETKKQDALSKLNTALTRAEKAREAARTEDVSDTFYWWRLLFNNEFPTYYY
ncbi:MAG: SMODS domain-containing nucleotidyltransferase [Leptospirillum sp.]